MSTRAGHARKDECDVYVGRPSRFGNPFTAHGTTSRYEVTAVDDPITAYEEHVRSSPELMASLAELRGKTLGCWCVRATDPQPMAGMERCHAEVLVRLVEEALVKETFPNLDPDAGPDDPGAVYLPTVVGEEVS